jgi:GNAT superfamily N-acetyltransferase
MLLITTEIARRLETAEAIDAAGCAEAQCRVLTNGRASVKPIAGGVAVYCGAESPLSHALAIGMHGPVTPGEMDEIEAFFQQHEAPVTIDLCPYADPSLRVRLSERNYRIADFSHVMARCCLPGEPLPPESPGIEVRPAAPGEEDLYIKTVIGGFFSRAELSEEEHRIGKILFHMPCSSSHLAFVDGHPAGGGAISTRNGVASLFGDATIPAFRGRGVHSAVIRARMAEAQASGCDLLTAGTQPGSGSQRNYERMGFQVAYTKATMVLD